MLLPRAKAAGEARGWGGEDVPLLDVTLDVTFLLRAGSSFCPLLLPLLCRPGRVQTRSGEISRRQLLQPGH